jgi:hypothetical protein
MRDAPEGSESRRAARDAAGEALKFHMTKLHDVRRAAREALDATIGDDKELRATRRNNLIAARLAIEAVRREAASNRHGRGHALGHVDHAHGGGRWRRAVGEKLAQGPPVTKATITEARGMAMATVRDIHTVLAPFREAIQAAEDKDVRQRAREALRGARTEAMFQLEIARKAARARVDAAEGDDERRAAVPDLLAARMAINAFNKKMPCIGRGPMTACGGGSAIGIGGGMKGWRWQQHKLGVPPIC